MIHNTLKGEAWLMKAQELYNLKQKIKLLSEKESELSKELQEATQGKSYKFGGMRCYYEERKGSVDYKSVPQLMGVDLEPYRKPSIQIFKLSIDKV